jgi:hypothetical protein
VNNRTNKQNAVDGDLTETIVTKIKEEREKRAIVEELA